MMISCKKAAELTCQGLDRPLSIRQRMQLRFHVLMCRGCKAFMEQSRRLDQAIRQHFHDLDRATLEAEAQRLPPEACERIKQRLHEALHGHGPSQ